MTLSLGIPVYTGGGRMLIICASGSFVIIILMIPIGIRFVSARWYVISSAFNFPSKGGPLNKALSGSLSGFLSMRSTEPGGNLFEAASLALLVSPSWLIRNWCSYSDVFGQFFTKFFSPLAMLSLFNHGCSVGLGYLCIVPCFSRALFVWLIAAQCRSLMNSLHLLGWYLLGIILLPLFSSIDEMFLFALVLRIPISFWNCSAGAAIILMNALKYVITNC